jgi:hypothetical protein
MEACENCGAVIRPGAGFCAACGATAPEAGGTPVQPAQASQPGPPTPPTLAPGAQQAQPPGVPLQAPPGPPPPPGTPQMPYMPPPPQKRKMGRGWKIALVLGLVIIVLIIVGILFGVLVLVKVISAPADIANNYVRAINEGDLSSAYSDLAKQAQNEETKVAFDQKMGTFTGNIQKWFTSSININNGSATIVMDISLTNGSKVTWDMSLVKENGKWKILTPR